jgi:hypothetical protein
MGPSHLSFDQNNGEAKAFNVSNLKASMLVRFRRSNTFSNKDVKYIKN